MPLEQEYSIVADSTISSSPQPPSIDRDYDASLQIKRPARTYGRRQEVPLPKEPEIPSSFASGSSSYGSTHNTAPPGLSEEIPPTSPQIQLAHFETNVHSDGDSEEVSNASPKFKFGRKEKLHQLDEDEGVDDHAESSATTSHVTVAPTGFGRPFLLDESSSASKLSFNAGISDASPKFNFGWKEKLRQLDEDEDDDDHMNSSAPTGHATVAPTGFGRPFLLEDASSGSKLLTTEATPHSPPLASNDFFRSDPLSQEEQSSSQMPPSQEAFVLSSPKVAPPTRKRLSKVVHDSDSEPEPSKASSSTSPPSSSQPVHNINTPKSRSLSTTPPTSDDEMPMKILGKSRSAGKRKSVAHSRPSVPPLDLIEGPLSEPRMRTTSKTSKSKVKPLTKKEQNEMLKERVRMTASSNASIVIARGTISKYTKEAFFAQLQESNKQQTAPKTEVIPASDPIEAYSSPPGRTRTVNLAHASPLHTTCTTAPRTQPSLAPNDSDSDEPPEVLEMIKLAEARNKKEELRKMKQRALEQRQTKSSPHFQSLDDDDDDLEIVSPNPKTGVKEEENRRSAKKQDVSRTRKQQLQLAHVNPSKHKSSDAALLYKAGEGSPVILRQSDRLDQTSLSRVLAAQALKEARNVSKKKAEHWEKHGGHVAVAPEVPAEGLATTLKTIAEQGLKAAEANAANRMDLDHDDEDGDEDDDDWDPTMRGSASPEPMEDNDQGSEDENDENTHIEQDVDMANADDLEEDEVEEGKVRSTRRMVITSDSEGEKDENKPVSAAVSKPDRYRRATSSVDSVADDEYDKENNNDLMYDHSDDKENTAVVRHTLLGRSSRSIFDITSPGSPDGLSNEWAVRNQRSDLENENDGKNRRPFQELLSDKSPSATQLQSSNLTQSFAAQLQQASPLPTTLAPAPTLKSFLGTGSAASKSFSGFSQFSEGDDSENFGPVPMLQPGFSNLFESATERQRSPMRVNKATVESIGDDVFSANTSARQLKRTDTLDLTQDVSIALDLQPAFQVKEDLMRKADAIFEKEQAFVLEAALQKPNKKPKLYVNDHGFLTQTKPTDGTPEVYRPSPSQATYLNSSLRHSMLSPSEFRSRAPLRTLSVSSPHQPESPEQQPLRRLKKAASPTEGSDGVLYSPSTTPPLRQNAFDLLARGAAKAQTRAEAKKTHPGLNISEFLENEAAESDDEDNAFGFVKKKGGDDEDGEDLDRTLTELMDDKEMDEAEVAANLVLEKYQQQEQEHDQKVQELHEAAVSGLLRKKRTRGVGVDDSDEESDDEDNERARRAMKKLRTTDRGDIQALAANEATEAFAAVYNQSLKDDDDFAYLAAESNLDELMADNHDTERDDGADDYEEDEEEQETISPQEIMRIARRMKEDGMEEAAMDPEDVSWLDKDAEDDAPQVKTVPMRRPPRISQQDIDSLDIDGTMGRPFGNPKDQLTASNKQWYAQENKSRNAGTSRSVGGSAITGHAKVKSKTGASASRAEAQRTKAGTASASTAPSRSIKAERSLLSAIVDKSRHFA